MCAHSAEERTILQEIRKCLVEKEKHAPVFMAADEFSQWQGRHKDHYLHNGYLSIWNGIEVPSGHGEVVIRKKRTRDGEKPYLVFRDAECFHEYCRNARLLGVEAYALLGNKFSGRIKSIAREYLVPESAYDSLQAELEKFIGLNFTMEAPAQTVSDGQVYGSLYNYFKRSVRAKAVSVFKKHGIEVDVDSVEWDAALSTDDSPEVICMARADGKEGAVDANRLLDKILELMDRLEGRKGTKYDMKGNLLSQVVQTDRATNEFISCYYSALKARRSVWRPVAFSYQVLYAREKGTEYLKNPTFIQTCGNMSIGGMMEGQINAQKGVGLSEKAYQGILSLWRMVQDENVQDTTLLACAGDAGQVGKALSKELRTDEAKEALARSLLVSVLARKEDFRSSDAEGVECHE